MLGHIADVIIHAKFDDNRFRGLRVLIPPILPFSIGIAGRPYNSAVPCYTVMYFFTGLKPEILLHFRFCGTTWRMKIYVWHGSKQHNQPCDSSRTRSSSISPSGIAVRNTHTHTHETGRADIIRLITPSVPLCLWSLLCGTHRTQRMSVCVPLE